MFEDIATIFNRSVSKEEIAEVLNATPEAIIEFEKAYSAISDEENKASDNFFKIMGGNSRLLVSEMKATIKIHRKERTVSYE